MASRKQDKYRAPPAQGASLREYWKAWINEGLLQTLPFQEPDGDASPGFRNSVSRWDKDHYAYPHSIASCQSTFIRGFILNGSLVPTLRSMWPDPTILISWTGKLSLGASSGSRRLEGWN